MKRAIQEAPLPVQGAYMSPYEGGPASPPVAVMERPTRGNSPVAEIFKGRTEGPALVREKVGSRVQNRTVSEYIAGSGFAAQANEPYSEDLAAANRIAAQRQAEINNALFYGDPVSQQQVQDAQLAHDLAQGLSAQVQRQVTGELQAIRSNPAIQQVDSELVRSQTALHDPTQRDSRNAEQTDAIRAVRRKERGFLGLGKRKVDEHTDIIDQMHRMRIQDEDGAYDEQGQSYLARIRTNLNRENISKTNKKVGHARLGWGLTSMGGTALQVIGAKTGEVLVYEIGVGVGLVAAVPVAALSVLGGTVRGIEAYYQADNRVAKGIKALENRDLSAYSDGGMNGVQAYWDNVKQMVHDSRWFMKPFTALKAVVTRAEENTGRTAVKTQYAVLSIENALDGSQPGDQYTEKLKKISKKSRDIVAFEYTHTLVDTIRRRPGSVKAVNTPRLSMDQVDTLALSAQSFEEFKTAVIYSAEYSGRLAPERAELLRVQNPLNKAIYETRADRLERIVEARIAQLPQAQQEEARMLQESVARRLDIDLGRKHLAEKAYKMEMAVSEGAINGLGSFTLLKIAPTMIAQMIVNHSVDFAGIMEANNLGNAYRALTHTHDAIQNVQNIGNQVVAEFSKPAFGASNAFDIQGQHMNFYTQFMPNGTHVDTGMNSPLGVNAPAEHFGANHTFEANATVPPVSRGEFFQVFGNQQFKLANTQDIPGHYAYVQFHGNTINMQGDPLSLQDIQAIHPGAIDPHSVIFITPHEQTFNGHPVPPIEILNDPHMNHGVGFQFGDSNTITYQVVTGYGPNGELLTTTMTQHQITELVVSPTGTANAEHFLSDKGEWGPSRFPQSEVWSNYNIREGYDYQLADHSHHYAFTATVVGTTHVDNGSPVPVDIQTVTDAIKSGHVNLPPDILQYADHIQHIPDNGSIDQIPGGSTLIYGTHDTYVLDGNGILTDTTTHMQVAHGVTYNPVDNTIRLTDNMGIQHIVPDTGNHTFIFNEQNWELLPPQGQLPVPEAYGGPSVDLQTHFSGATITEKILPDGHPGYEIDYNNGHAPTYLTNLTVDTTGLHYDIIVDPTHLHHHDVGFAPDGKTIVLTNDNLEATAQPVGPGENVSNHDGFLDHSTLVLDSQYTLDYNAHPDYGVIYGPGHVQVATNVVYHPDTHTITLVDNFGVQHTIAEPAFASGQFSLTESNWHLIHNTGTDTLEDGLHTLQFNQPGTYISEDQGGLGYILHRPNLPDQNITNLYMSPDGSLHYSFADSKFVALPDHTEVSVNYDTANHQYDVTASDTDPLKHLVAGAVGENVSNLDGFPSGSHLFFDGQYTLNTDHNTFTDTSGQTVYATDVHFHVTDQSNGNGTLTFFDRLGVEHTINLGGNPDHTYSILSQDWQLHQVPGHDTATLLDGNHHIDIGNRGTIVLDADSHGVPNGVYDVTITDTNGIHTFHITNLYYENGNLHFTQLDDNYQVIANHTNVDVKFEGSGNNLHAVLTTSTFDQTGTTPSGIDWGGYAEAAGIVLVGGVALGVGGYGAIRGIQHIREERGEYAPTPENYNRILAPLATRATNPFDAIAIAQALHFDPRQELIDRGNAAPTNEQVSAHFFETLQRAGISPRDVENAVARLGAADGADILIQNLVQTPERLLTRLNLNQGSRALQHLITELGNPAITNRQELIDALNRNITTPAQAFQLQRGILTALQTNRPLQIIREFRRRLGMGPLRPEREAMIAQIDNASQDQTFRRELTRLAVPGTDLDALAQQAMQRLHLTRQFPNQEPIAVLNNRVNTARVWDAAANQFVTPPAGHVTNALQAEATALGHPLTPNDVLAVLNRREVIAPESMGEAFDRGVPANRTIDDAGFFYMGQLLGITVRTGHEREDVLNRLNTEFQNNPAQYNPPAVMDIVTNAAPGPDTVAYIAEVADRFSINIVPQTMLEAVSVGILSTLGVGTPATIAQLRDQVRDRLRALTDQTTFDLTGVQAFEVGGDNFGAIRTAIEGAGNGAAAGEEADRIAGIIVGYAPGSRALWGVLGSDINTQTARQEVVQELATVFRREFQPQTNAHPINPLEQIYEIASQLTPQQAAHLVTDLAALTPPISPQTVAETIDRQFPLQPDQLLPRAGIANAADLHALFLEAQNQGMNVADEQALLNRIQRLPDQGAMRRIDNDLRTNRGNRAALAGVLLHQTPFVESDGFSEAFSRRVPRAEQVQLLEDLNNAGVINGPDAATRYTVLARRIGALGPGNAVRFYNATAPATNRAEMVQRIQNLLP